MKLHINEDIEVPWHSTRRDVALSFPGEEGALVIPADRVLVNFNPVCHDEYTLNIQERNRMWMSRHGDDWHLHFAQTNVGRITVDENIPPGGLDG